MVLGPHVRDRDEQNVKSAGPCRYCTNRERLRDRKQSGGYEELGGKESREVVFPGCRVSVGDEEVLEVDGSVGSTTV